MRGIQEISIHQPIATNIFAFKYLLAYFVAVAGIGVTLHHACSASRPT